MKLRPTGSSQSSCLHLLEAGIQGMLFSGVKLSSRNPEPQMGHGGLLLRTADGSAWPLPHCVSRRKGAEGRLDLMLTRHITLGDLDF